MAFRLGTAARSAACDAIVDLLDVGGAGTIMIRTGAQPTNVGDTPTGQFVLALLASGEFGLTVQ